MRNIYRLVLLVLIRFVLLLLLITVAVCCFRVLWGGTP